MMTEQPLRNSCLEIWMLHGASPARNINRSDLWWRCPGADDPDRDSAVAEVEKKLEGVAINLVFIVVTFAFRKE